MAEFVAHHEFHLTHARAWKSQPLENAASMFGRNATAKHERRIWELL